MSLKPVWDFLVDNILSWLVVFGTVLKAFELWKKSQVGGIIVTFLIGVALFFIFKYPLEIFEIIAKIPDLFFGLGKSKN